MILLINQMLLDNMPILEILTHRIWCGSISRSTSMITINWYSATLSVKIHDFQWLSGESPHIMWPTLWAGGCQSASSVIGIRIASPGEEPWSIPGSCIICCCQRYFMGPQPDTGLGFSGLVHVPPAWTILAWIVLWQVLAARQGAGLFTCYFFFLEKTYNSTSLRTSSNQKFQLLEDLSLALFCVYYELYQKSHLIL